MTSWITFSCQRLNGPPYSRNPILLAGTWKQYSKNAIPQLTRIMLNSPRLLNQFICLNFRCPYHASVMKLFDRIKRAIVQTGLFIHTLCLACNNKTCMTTRVVVWIFCNILLASGCSKCKNSRDFSCSSAICSTEFIRIKRITISFSRTDIGRLPNCGHLCPLNSKAWQQIKRQRLALFLSRSWLT